MKLLHEIYKNIDYNEIEIYSYNQGALLSNYLSNLEIEKKRLNKEMEFEDEFDKQLELNTLAKYLEKYDPLQDELMNGEEELHPTAKCIIKLKKKDLIAKEVDEIFCSEIVTPITSRCLAEFRDGIIFKKDDVLKGVFSICFGCATIKSKSMGVIYGDIGFYKSYKKILLKIGHDVNEKYDGPKFIN